MVRKILPFLVWLSLKHSLWGAPEMEFMCVWKGVGAGKGESLQVTADVKFQ